MPRLEGVDIRNADGFHQPLNISTAVIDFVEKAIRGHTKEPRLPVEVGIDGLEDGVGRIVELDGQRAAKVIREVRNFYFIPKRYEISKNNST